MFKTYRDISDVVSLLVYCPAERAFLLSKESSGEYWIPCSRSDKNCWKSTAHKINFELFGLDAATQYSPLRIYKIWLPDHPQPCVYHAIYKVVVKPDVKKKTKLRAGIRNRLQWFTSVELERQRLHASLRSPEVATFAQMAMGDISKDNDSDIETGLLVEICENNALVSSDMASMHCQLLQAASYTKDDQIRLYREFMLMIYPALYMSPVVFTQFMMDLGWQRDQCSSLFRAADITCRGGLSFLEVLLWSAALEPATEHTGLPAEIRCRYIFRYFDTNRDLKLEYLEFKELIAAARAARQLPVDALSVAKDADVCLKQLGLGANAALPLAEFLRAVGEQRLRGTGSLLRAPTGVAAYLVDLQYYASLLERDVQKSPSLPKIDINQETTGVSGESVVPVVSVSGSAHGEYELSSCVARLHPSAPPEMLHLSHFDEDAVSASSTRVTSARAPEPPAPPAPAPAAVLAAVHYFATCAPRTQARRASGGGSISISKAAYAWAAPEEEAAMGAQLLQLAGAVRDICAHEPRMLRLASPIYAIGDLHGNLAGLLAMESVLWPSGTALLPSQMLFLGDYVDRGQHGTELMAYLLATKLQRPNSVYLVRGNHETRDIQKMFSFHTECVDKYGEIEGPRIWNAINQVFDVLPLAAVVDDKVFCCHGGIPPPWLCPLISAIDKVPSPLPRPADQSALAWDLMWNDPVKANKMTASLSLELAAHEGFAANARRGTGHVFDRAALARFLRVNRLSLVLRAHEMHQNGFMCQQNGRLISVFSSSRYCGGTNDSAVALLHNRTLSLIRFNTD